MSGSTCIIHENMGLAVQHDCVKLLPIELILQ
jgi:hypothetical protein